MPRIFQICLRPSARTPVQTVTSVRAIAGKGLEGDHAGGGSRQMTLLDREAWNAACRELGKSIDPCSRRANIVVEGLPLANTRGQRIQLGDCIVEIVGESRPCKLMDDVAPGLQKALSVEGRGGAYGRVIRGGLINIGDEVKLLPGNDTDAK